MKFKFKLEKYKDKFENFLKSYVEQIKDIDKKLLDSMKYSLFSGGKRIRPILMLATYEVCGGKSEEIYRFASALEMIHTYSLIHDDLPCMDNDTLRRGISCNHIVFGEDIALLAGDSLLTYAFEIMSSCDNSEFNSNDIMKSIKILAFNSGCSGMINGQCLDLNCKVSCIDELINIYSLKTACLISAAAEIGAVLAGASERKIVACRKYGKFLGLCFQIVDDIIDNEEFNLSFFKNPTATDLLKDFIEKAKNELDILDSDVSFLKDFADFLIFKAC